MAQPKDFQKLQKKWYDKLKKLGFNDIEQDEYNLKSWDAHRFLPGLRLGNGKYSGNRASNNQATTDYYYYATHFLNNHKFQKEIHKIIWEEHVDGKTLREIADILTKDNAYKISHVTVGSIIKYYKDIMLKGLK